MTDIPDNLYCVTSPEPTTPAAQFAKALAEALQSDPAISIAFVAALQADPEGADLDILDDAVLALVPEGAEGAATRETLETLKQLQEEAA